MYEEEEAPLTQTLNTFQMSLNDLEDDVRDTQSMQSRLSKEMSSQREKICKLQLKCQEEQHAIDLLEETRKNARDYFESSSSTIKKVESKQLEVNEKLDLMMKAYDSNYLRCQAVKQSFNEKVKVLNRFQSIQDQDLNDVANIGSATLELIKTNFEEKQRLYEQIKDIESSDESLDEQMSTLENHLEMSNGQLENFKKAFSELKKEGEITIFKSNNLKSTIEQIESRASLNLDEWNSKWIKEEEKLNEIKRSNEEYLNKMDRLKTSYKNSSNHLGSERRRAHSLQQCLEELKEEYSKVESEIAKIKEEQKGRLGVNDLIAEINSRISQTKKDKEDLNLKMKQLNIEISSSKDKLEQLFQTYSIFQAEIAEIESEKNLQSYIQQRSEAIVEMNNLAEQKKIQNAAEKESLKKNLAEANALSHEKRKACQVILKTFKRLQEEFKNIQGDVNEKEAMTRKIDNEIASAHELREKQKSLEEERDYYYNLYNAGIEDLQKRQHEIEEVKIFNQKLVEAKKQFESLKEETLNKVKDRLKTKTDDLMKSKTELKAKVDKEKAFMSRIQYDYYTSKNNFHESQKRLATLRAMSEIAKCENEAVKAFVCWMTSGVDLSKFLKNSGPSEDQGSQVKEKDEFLFSQMVDIKTPNVFGTVHGSQDMELDEIQETERRLEAMEKSQHEAELKWSPPPRPYNKNEFTSVPEKGIQLSDEAYSVINLISEDQDDKSALRNSNKLVKSQCDSVINLISSEGDKTQFQSQQIPPRKVLSLQSQSRNAQIKKPASVIQPSIFKTPQAKENRIFKSVNRNPFSLCGTSAHSSKSLKHTYEPTKLYDSDTDNNPYSLFASPKPEVSSTSSKKPPKRSSQNSQKPRKKSAPKKSTASKKKDFDEKAHQDRMMNYIQSVQKK